MKFLLVAFLVTIAAQVAIAFPHHNGTSHHHHHHPGGQQNGTDAVDAPAGEQRNRTFQNEFRFRPPFFDPWSPPLFYVNKPVIEDPVPDVI
uniref:Putative hhh secreted protein n=1 Tax=Psorophora albipes TaxID=869069 RepID=T1E2S3_9DIPT